LGQKVDFAAQRRIAGRKPAINTGWSLVDWPSRELSQRLAEWRLCTPQDVQRCRRAVRSLVRDLPSFDSVWIDVLLQHRLLTP